MNKTSTGKPVVRFAPSPTGPFHIGSARTALFAFLFARHNDGKFLLRIEDTDKERSKPEFETEIIQSLKWLGLNFDGDLIRQSERGANYKQHLEKLISGGHAYVSKEEPKDGGRSEVIRFKNPGTKITFTDEIRGEITFDTSELKDFVIAKSLDEPLFHLAVVVDDFEMGITHVIRGEDHISNTPRQILLQKAIGAPEPKYAHIPLILAPDRSKLSKRKHGESVALSFFQESGFLPEAVINFLALLGWSDGNDQEIFSLDGLIQKFSFGGVHKSGAIFNQEKLNWLNREYLKKFVNTPEFDIKSVIPDRFLQDKNNEQLRLLFDTLIERISVWGDIKKLEASGEIDYLVGSGEVALDPLKIGWKGATHEQSRQNLELAKNLIETIPEGDFSPEGIKKILWPTAEKIGKGDLLWPLRFALTGQEKSPDPFTVLAIIGKVSSLKRISEAINQLK